jgi:hypothetical protein
MRNRHLWSTDDDLVALYLFRFGEAGLSIRTNAIGAQLGMGAASLRMRVQNFRAIDGGGGLDNYAKQSKQVFDQYGGSSQAELKQMVDAVVFHPKWHSAQVSDGLSPGG